MPEFIPVRCGRTWFEKFKKEYTYFDRRKYLEGHPVICPSSFRFQSYSAALQYGWPYFCRTASWTKASAAIGASGLIVTCLIGFFNGMAVGTNVFAARHYGAKRFNELKKLIQTIFWTGIIGGLLLMVIGLIFSPIFLTWMGTPKSIFPLAVRYLRIYMVSMISIVSYNLLRRSMESVRRLENTVTVSVLWWNHQCICWLYLFSSVHMGVEGTALATFFPRQLRQSELWYIYIG